MYLNNYSLKMDDEKGFRLSQTEEMDVKQERKSASQNKNSSINMPHKDADSIFGGVIFWPLQWRLLGRTTRQDAGLLIAIIIFLLSTGLVMIMSASLEVATGLTGNPFHFVSRHAIYLLIGAFLATLVYQIPLERLASMGGALLLVGVLLLFLVFTPGLGHEVNGSRRWLKVGPITIQASELTKLFVLIYLSGYLVRRQNEVRHHWRGILKPLLILFFIGLLLLAEPDFGAFVVISFACMGMIFLSGVKLSRFALIVGVAILCAAVLAVLEPYRLQRVLSFINPWDFKYSSGYQLTQSLIAFGRGEWFGVGLGESVQKLFYLPEAHTDFVLAVLAEELGLVGVLVVSSCFLMITLIAFRFGFQAEQKHLDFYAYLAYGIGLSIGIQAFVNIGVNIGILPTKGLTLPLVSYGGSSLVVSMVMIAILLKIERELRDYE